MAVRNRQAFHIEKSPTTYGSAEGPDLLQSLIAQLEHQDQLERATGDVSRLGGQSGLPGEFHEPLDKERVVRRLIQRLSEDS
jgi:hypothetical protein